MNNDVKKVAILIPIYKEEINIKNLIPMLLKQRFSKKFILSRIVIVASECREETRDIIKEFIKKNKKIKLIHQDKRRGKADAINFFLKSSPKEQILVVECADTLPTSIYTINNLIKPLENSKVGMTGGRALPLNNPKTFVGFINHLIYYMLHEISLKDPKLGELIAFKNLVKKIPKKTIVDEVAIEYMIKKKGLEIYYAKDAKFWKLGCEKLCELIEQRKRFHMGHIYFLKTKNYRVSTMNLMNVIEAFFKYIKNNPKKILLSLCAALLEIFIRTSAYLDFYIFKETYTKKMYVWPVCRTSKVDLKRYRYESRYFMYW